MGLPYCWIGSHVDLMKPARYAIIAGLLFTFGITIAVYPAVPDMVASHWNAAGQVDGHMVKFWGLFIIPLIMAGCAGLFALLPRIDPLKKNYEKFSAYYDGFVFVFVLFLLVIQAQLILWNLGYQISPNLTFPVLFGILFIYIGFMLDHAEQNWFVGIRTPWTLSSALVWKKTHDLGGKLFKIAGIISFFGALAGTYAYWFMLAPVIVVAIITVVYSYIEYQKELERKGQPA
jgi:uncharacterized membrane protein